MADKKAVIGGGLAAVIGLAALAACVLGAILLVGGLKYMGGADVEEVAGQLPADTTAMVAGFGLVEAGLQFRDAVGAEELGGEDIAALREEAQVKCLDKLGFDCTDPAAWLATGLGLDRPWGVALLGGLDPREAEVLVLVPVGDAEALLGTVHVFLDKNGLADEEEQPVGGHTVHAVGPAAFVVGDDYLVLFTAMRDGFDPVAAAGLYLERDAMDSLAGEEHFRELAATLGSEWHLFGYLSPGAMAEGRALLERSLHGLAQKLGSRGAGGTLHVDDSRLRARLAIGHDPDPFLSAMGSFQGRDRLGSQLGGEAVLAARVSADLPLLWDELEKTPDFKDQVGEVARGIRDQWGVDLETDVVGNLGGDVTAVVLASADSQAPLDPVVYAAVRDSAKAVAVLDAVAAKLRGSGMALSTDARDGESWYFTEQGGVGVAQGHLVAVVGQGALGRVQKSLREADGSFLSSLPERISSNIEAGPPAFAYFDLARALELLGGARGLQLFVDTAFIEAGTTFVSAISASATVRSDQLVVLATVHAPPEGFAAATRNYVEKGLHQLRLTRAREGLSEDVDSLRSAQMAHQAVFDEYVPCGDEERARAAVTTQPREWEGNACWEKLGWRPEGKVMGAYWIEQAGWYGFEVHGVMDADGDGRYAEVVATRSRSAHLVSAIDVY